MRRILCFLGWHDWWINFALQRACRHCPKRQYRYRRTWVDVD